MPQAIPIAAAAATAVTTFATTTLGSALISIGIGLAASYVASRLAAGKQDSTPQEGQINIRQAVGPRRSGMGRDRIGGTAVLYEAASDGYSCDIYALHDGEIDGFEAFYLGDDLVTLDGSGVVSHPDYYHTAAGQNVVSIQTRRGTLDQTAFGLSISKLPGVWTEAHRGLGVAALELICAPVGENDYQKAYPNGLASPTTVARLSRVYDPRNESTAWSPNSALGILFYLTYRYGAGLDFERHILPAIDLWAAAADVCDEAVPLAAGGTEPRYRLGGTFSHDDVPSAVLDDLLATCDGWLWQRGDGSIGFRAGKFYEPTVTIGEEHIRGYTLQLGQAIEQTVTEVRVSYIEPAQDYAEADMDPWRNNLEAVVGRSLARDVSLPWVRSHTQARRLAKRISIGEAAPRRGTVTTDLYGLNAMGERYINLSIPELFGNEIVPVEVIDMEIDLMSGATITWREADPNIDDWNPEAEEGTPPGTVVPFVPEATQPPADLAAEANTFSGSTLITVTFTGDYDDRGNQIAIEYRIHDIGGGAAGTWQRSTFPAADDGAGNYSYDVGPVIAGTTYDLRVAIITASGAWTAYTDPVEVET